MNKMQAMFEKLNRTNLLFFIICRVAAASLLCSRSGHGLETEHSPCRRPATDWLFPMMPAFQTRQVSVRVAPGLI